MSLDSNQIQLYVNLEPYAVRDNASINYKTYFDHLLRAVEIPMIHFLEQLYNEASIRAKNDAAATPLEFQVILREFVREPSEERKKIFIEHLQNGKHNLDHLGTIALLALRELTQSLASSDYELVALAQSQSDVPRFQVQTAITYLDLFIAAEIESARQMDRNPTYFSRTVSSNRYLENRNVIRSEIEKALAAAINDNAIKSYLSLRQHIADSAMQKTNAKTALQDQQQQQRQKKSDFRADSQSKKDKQKPVAQKTWSSALDVDNLADTPSLPSPKKPEKTPMIMPSSQKQKIMDLDQRASPLSSNEAQQVKKEFDSMLQNPSKQQNLTQQTKTQPLAQQQQLPIQQQQSQPVQSLQKNILQEGHIRLAEPAVQSAQTASKKPEEIAHSIPRAHSDNMIRKEVGLTSEDFLDGDENQDEEEGDEEESNE